MYSCRYFWIRISPWIILKLASSLSFHFPQAFAMAYSSSSVATEVVLVEQAKLLVAIFSPRRQGDVGRLASLSSKIAALGIKNFFT
jgi:hypothetical protein